VEQFLHSHSYTPDLYRLLSSRLPETTVAQDWPDPSLSTHAELLFLSVVKEAQNWCFAMTGLKNVQLKVP
jgi:hypothetical protein